MVVAYTVTPTHSKTESREKTGRETTNKGEGKLNHGRGGTEGKGREEKGGTAQHPTANKEF